MINEVSNDCNTKTEALYGDADVFVMLMYQVVIMEDENKGRTMVDIRTSAQAYHTQSYLNVFFQEDLVIQLPVIEKGSMLNELVSYSKQS